MKRPFTDIVLGAIFCVAMLVAIGIIATSFVPRQSQFSSPDPPIDFDKGWTTSDGETIAASKLYEKAQHEGEPIVIFKQLPST